MTHYITYRVRLVVILGVIMLLPAASALTQGVNDDCSAVVVSALDAMDQFCEATGQNQACYGHTLIDAALASNAEGITFVAEGDIVDVSSLRSLRLSGLDMDAGVWGVALLRLRANLPAEVVDNVSLLAFGDVTLQDASGNVPLAVIEVNGIASLNVRRLPAMDAFVLGTLRRGQSTTATGQTADGGWLRVVEPRSGETGWVAAPYVQFLDGERESLAVVNPYAIYYGPMQAFYLDSTDVDGCVTVSNGLVIQTPEGAGQVRFLVNEVGIQLGSTIFVWMNDAGEMVVQLLEGHARVEAQGVTQALFPGTQVRIPMGAAGTHLPAGPPSLPESYDGATPPAAVVAHLDRPIVPADPMTPEEIVRQQDAANGNSGGGQTSDGGDGGHTPPGLVDNPALGNDGPPGHGGTPPGQAKEN